jgi:hypothetical protein
MYPRYDHDWQAYDYEYRTLQGPLLEFWPAKKQHKGSPVPVSLSCTPY